MADLAAALFARLSTDAAVAALVAQRIYPIIAPQEAATPFIVQARSSTQRFTALSGPGGLAQARVEISAWADTFDACRALADAVRLALDGFSGSAGGVVIRASRLDAERDGRNDEAASTGLFVAALDFVITYEEEA